MSHGWVTDGSMMSHIWVTHCYMWESDESQINHRMGYRLVSDESKMGHKRWVTFEYSISHLLQTYQSLTPLQPCHTSDIKNEYNFRQIRRKYSSCISYYPFLTRHKLVFCTSGYYGHPLTLGSFCSTNFEKISEELFLRFREVFWTKLWVNFKTNIEGYFRTFLDEFCLKLKEKENLKKIIWREFCSNFHEILRHCQENFEYYVLKIRANFFSLFSPWNSTLGEIIQPK